MAATITYAPTPAELQSDKDVVDQLHNIYDQNPSAWIKGKLAVDSKGKRVSTTSDDVCGVCLSGGLSRLSHNDSQSLRLQALVAKLLPGKYQGSSIPGFNDAVKTSVDDVKALLKHVSTHLKHFNGAH